MPKEREREREAEWARLGSVKVPAKRGSKLDRGCLSNEPRGERVRARVVSEAETAVNVRLTRPRAELNGEVPVPNKLDSSAILETSQPSERATPLALMTSLAPLGPHLHLRPTGPAP